MRKLIVSVAIATLAFACGDDGDDGGGGDPTAASIVGEVTYDGSSTGSLMIALYPGMIPGGPPAFMKALGTASFPHSYELTDVPAGTWYVFAVFDVGADNPTVPGPEDFMVAATETVTIDDTTGELVRDIAIVE